MLARPAAQEKGKKGVPRPRLRACARRPTRPAQRRSAEGAVSRAQCQVVLLLVSHPLGCPPKRPHSNEQKAAHPDVRIAALGQAQLCDDCLHPSRLFSGRHRVRQAHARRKVCTSRALQGSLRLRDCCGVLRCRRMRLATVVQALATALHWPPSPSVSKTVRLGNSTSSCTAAALCR